VLLNSETTKLVISLEFTRKNKFKKRKLNKSIYVRNIDSIFNHEELIQYKVEAELFYREYKEKMEINAINR